MVKALYEVKGIHIGVYIYNSLTMFDFIGPIAHHYRDGIGWMALKRQLYYDLVPNGDASINIPIGKFISVRSELANGLGG